MARALGVLMERFPEGVEDPAEGETAAPPEKCRGRKRQRP
jgi:hypothetical protein